MPTRSAGNLVRWAVVLGAALLTGCSATTHQKASAPTLGGDTRLGSGRILPDEVQSAVMSFADRYVQSVADASDRVATDAPQAVRVLLLQNRTATAQGSFTIAAGPNPVIAMLDMTVFVTLKRMVFEEYWTRENPGTDMKPLVEAYRRGEEDIWTLAREVLTTEGEQELQGLIRRWRADNPDQRYVSQVRFSSFDVYRNRPSEMRSGNPSSVFALLYLDPLSGLDPSLREVGQLRRMMERESYFMERLPIIMAYLVPQLGAEYMDSPGARRVLADMSGLVGAAQQFSAATVRFASDLGAQGQMVVDRVVQATAKEGEALIGSLSELAGRERRALMEELSTVLDSQRSALVADMESHEQRVRAVLADAKATAEALRTLSESVRGTIQAADGLVRRADAADPNDNPGTGSRPFDVREYEAAAARISEAAKEVTRTIETIEKPGAAGGGEAEATALVKAVVTLEQAIGRTIDRAFHRILVLVGAAVLGWGAIWTLGRRRGGRTGSQS